MKKIKRYESKAWLVRKLFREGKTVEEIAAECGVQPRTIYRKIEKFNIKI